MEKELRAQWLEALRCGHYDQTTGLLYNPFLMAYCCLGVLADVAGITHNGTACLDDTGESVNYKPLEDLFVRGHEITFELFNRNDGNDGHKPHTFAEIADWIEANVPAVVDEPVV